MEDLPSDIQKFLSDFDVKMDQLELVVENLCNNDYLEKNLLTPYEMAKYNLCTAYALNSLFHVYLKSQGIASLDHPVMKELERMKLYSLKLKNLSDEEIGKLTNLDVEAVNRFIQHGIGSSAKKAKKHDFD